VTDADPAEADAPDADQASEQPATRRPTRPPAGTAAGPDTQRSRRRTGTQQRRSNRGGHRRAPGRPRDEPPPPVTGDDAVDAATAEVGDTAGDPLEARLAAYERAHRTLQDRLADVEG
jgi:hypothetical protein